MSKIKLWYSVANGGDGSAHPVFFSTEDQAKAHQEDVNSNEGWAEDCYGLIEVDNTDGVFSIGQNSIGMDDTTYEDIYPDNCNVDTVAVLEVT